VELNYLYYSPYIIRVMKSGGMRWPDHVARMGKRSDACMVLVGKSEGTRPLGKPVVMGE